MKICDNGTIRDMTPEEEAIAQNLPDPTDMPINDTEVLDILLGGDAEAIEILLGGTE